MKTILIVEDNEDDIYLLQRAFKRVGIQNPLQVVRDGEHAVQYLLGRGDYYDRSSYPLPSLVLLDLKLPRCTGHEVLNWIRSHPTFFNLPVIILSGSELSDDIELAWRLGANSFLAKPAADEELLDSMRKLKIFWENYGEMLEDSVAR